MEAAESSSRSASSWRLGKEAGAEAGAVGVEGGARVCPARHSEQKLFKRIAVGRCCALSFYLPSVSPTHAAAASLKGQGRPKGRRAAYRAVRLDDTKHFFLALA